MLYFKLSLKIKLIIYVGIINDIDVKAYAAWNEYTLVNNRKDINPIGVNIHANNRTWIRYLDGIFSINYTIPLSYKLILVPTCITINAYSYYLWLMN